MTGPLPQIVFLDAGGTDNRIHFADERVPESDVEEAAISATLADKDDEATWGIFLTEDHARQLRAWLDVVLDAPAGPSPT